VSEKKGEINGFNGVTFHSAARRQATVGRESDAG
jgi:hypothetical protein